MARSAIASGTALGAPAGVNPLKPTVCPFWIREAASAAVKIGNECIKSSLRFARDFAVCRLIAKQGQKLAAGREGSRAALAYLFAQLLQTRRDRGIPPEEIFQPRPGQLVHPLQGLACPQTREISVTRKQFPVLHRRLPHR